MSLLNVLFRRERIKQASRYILDDSVVCDIGCGINAEFLLSVEHRIRKGIGIDFRIKNTKFRNIELLKFDLEKPSKLEFNDNQFDHVVLLAILEHLRRPEMIVKEAYRILAPGGSLIVTSPVPLSKNILRLLLLTPFFDDEEEASKHKGYFSGKALKEIFLDAGFVNITFKKFEFGFNSIVAGYKQSKV